MPSRAKNLTLLSVREPGVRGNLPHSFSVNYVFQFGMLGF